MSQYSEIDLHSLAPLLELLPGDSRIMDHTIPATVFAPFRECAARVRSLYWVESDHRAWRTLDTAALLPISHTTADLLPNLRTLSATCASSSGARMLAPWISSSLTTVDIAFEAEVDDAAVAAVLSALDRCAHRITSFSLSMPSDGHRSWPVLYQAALLRTLVSMRALRVARVPLCAPFGRHLAALGEMRHLEELSICPTQGGEDSVNEDDEPLARGSEHGLDSLDEIPSLLLLPEVSIPPAAPAPTALFPALRTLHLSGAWRAIAPALGAATFPARYLDLQAPSVQDAHEMAAALRAAAARCPRLALARIHILRRANLQWIDVAPLGAVPCAVFVARAKYRTRGLTLEQERVFGRLDVWGQSLLAQSLATSAPHYTVAFLGDLRGAFSARRGADSLSELTFHDISYKALLALKNEEASLQAPDAKQGFALSQTSLLQAAIDNLPASDVPGLMSDERNGGFSSARWALGMQSRTWDPTGRNPHRAKTQQLAPFKKLSTSHFNHRTLCSMRLKEILNFSSSDYEDRIRGKNYTFGELARDIYIKRRAIASSKASAVTSAAAVHVTGGTSLFGTAYAGRNISVEKQKLALLERFWEDSGAAPLPRRHIKDTVIPIALATAVGVFAFSVDLAIANAVSTAATAAQMGIPGYTLPVSSLVISGEYFAIEKGMGWAGKKVNGVVAGGYSGYDGDKKVREKRVHHHRR
ncbi:hypothetical protein HWV62_12304 [Athelia sp. TMB]|nr:hypothetical protein HWV62_12304 [Athelia sp. TMB]